MATTPVSAEDIQRATEAMQLMTAQLERAGQQASAIGKKVFKDWENDAGAAVDRLEKESKTLGEHMKSAITAPITLGIKALKVYQDEVKKTAKIFNEGMGAGADKAGGLFTGANKVATEVMSKFPMAGFFGFLLYGRMDQAKWKAEAQSATQVFQNSGKIAAGTLGSMYSNIRNLSASIPGIASSFGAGAAAAAQMGITSAQAMEKTSYHIRGADRSAMSLGVAMNKLYEAGDGTSEKAAATLVQNTNLGYKESLELLNKMGAAVQGTGISYSALLATVMQTTSSLRLQGVEAKSIGEAIQASKAGFGAQGMKDARAGTIAMAGVQGIAGAISGLSVGLKAVLGEGMTGGRSKGLTAVRQFDMGMLEGKEGGGDKFGATIKEMLKMAEKAGGGDQDRMYFAIQQLFGINTEGAATMMSIYKANKEGTDINKAIKDNSKKLAGALDTEGLKQSKFETMMNELIRAVATLGVSLLDAIITGLGMVVSAIKYHSKVLPSNEETLAYKDLGELANKNLSSTLTKGKGALVQIGKTAGKFGEEILGDSKYMNALSDYMSNTDYAKKAQDNKVNNQEAWNRYKRITEMKAKDQVTQEDRDNVAKLAEIIRRQKNNLPQEFELIIDAATLKGRKKVTFRAIPVNNTTQTED